jgi:hypothetical protein
MKIELSSFRLTRSFMFLVAVANRRFMTADRASFLIFSLEARSSWMGPSIHVFNSLNYKLPSCRFSVASHVALKHRSKAS